MSRVRVLYLSHAFMVGGAEDMVLNLVRYLPDRFAPAQIVIRTGVPKRYDPSSPSDSKFVAMPRPPAT